VTAVELVESLSARGLDLCVADGRIGVQPAGRLSDQERALIRTHKSELLTLLANTPESLIDICRKHGVGLRIDPDGTVVVESYGKAWRALVAAIAAHVDEIASIMLATGDGRQFSVRRCDA
jgi:tubulysin polyketide synthase-like protein